MITKYPSAASAAPRNFAAKIAGVSKCPCSPMMAGTQLTASRFQLQRFELSHQRIGEDQTARHHAGVLRLCKDRHLERPRIEPVQHEADVERVDDLRAQRCLAELHVRRQRFRFDRRQLRQDGFLRARVRKLRMVGHEAAVLRQAVARIAIERLAEIRHHGHVGRRRRRVVVRRAGGKGGAAETEQRKQAPHVFRTSQLSREPRFANPPWLIATGNLLSRASTVK